MFTELRISSMLISTITAFLRAMTPYTPMQNSTAPSSRNSLTSISILPSQHDRADDGCEEEERQRPERQQVGPEDAVAERGGGHRGGVLRQLGAAEPVDQNPRHHTEHHERHR